MIVVGADPGVFAFPEKLDAEAARRALGRIENLYNVTTNPEDSVTVQLPRDSCLTLAEIGLYPAKPRLAELLSCAQVAHVYSANDLSMMVSILLDRYAELESKLGINDTIADDFLMDPALHDRHVFHELGALLGDSALKLATTRSRPGNGFRLSALLSPVALDDEHNVLVSATLEMIDPVDAAPEDLPHRISKLVPILAGGAGLLDAIPAREMWVHVRTDSDAALAIRSRAFELCREANLDPPANASSLVLGPEFLPSVRESGAAGNGPFAQVTLDAAARVVAKLPNLGARPFRIDVKPTSPQLIRSDGAAAFRLHVTKDHEGLRMMYWEWKCGRIELSRVANKSDAAIG